MMSSEIIKKKQDDVEKQIQNKEIEVVGALEDLRKDSTNICENIYIPEKRHLEAICDKLEAKAKFEARVKAKLEAEFEARVKAEVEARIKAEFEAKKVEKGYKVFPPNLQCIGNSSTTVKKQKTDKNNLQLKLGEFKQLESVRTINLDSSTIWDIYGKHDNCLMYYSESDVVRHVVTCLEDIFYSLSLKYFITQEEIPVPVNEKNSSPHVLTIQSHDVVLGVVLVKKPSNNMFDKNSPAFTQMNSYLRDLMNFGVMAPIGIVTTYKQWSFCWLEHVNSIANAIDTNFIIPEGDVNENIMYYSSPVDVESESLLPLLSSYFDKCSLIPRCAMSNNMWVKYSTDNISIEKNLNIELKTNRIPDDVTQLYLYKFLGRGTGGKALKVCDKNGNYCVAKFCAKEQDIDLEVNALNDAYGQCNAQKAQLNKENVILMLYRDLLSEDDFACSSIRLLIITHVEELFNKGIIHGDLERRHVVWIEKNKKIGFIDWGHVSRVKDGENIDDVVEDAKQRLEL